MNILIIDDEIYTLNEINFYVEKYNKFECCVTCTNPFQALYEAKKTSFDIALLDIEMPGMNGFELAEQLSNMYPNIKLIFITAYNSYATEAFAVNAIDYILKPIREQRLIKALDKVVDKKIDDFKTKNDIQEVYIQTFGKFIIKIGDNVVKWNRKKSYELFAYLLENKEMPVRKEKLCDLLWPNIDPKKALVNLQSTIYSIRKSLKAYNNYGIRINYLGDNYILNLENVHIDMIEFQEILGQALHLKDENLLRNALEIYKEDYLDEEGWIWAEPKKEELRKKYVAAIKELENLSGKLLLIKI